MSAPSDYSRTAILAWANALLETNHTKFAEVPMKDLALLLYGVYNAAGPSTSVSLQDIQFTPHLTPTILHRNAQHLLSILKRLSKEEAQASAVGGGGGAASPVVIDPQLTASEWLEGKAFVEELKIWRWLRAKAEALQAQPASIRAAMRRFLHGDTAPAAVAEGGGAGRGETHGQDAPEKDATRTPVVHKRSRSALTDNLSSPARTWEGSSESASTRKETCPGEPPGASPVMPSAPVIATGVGPSSPWDATLAAFMKENEATGQTSAALVANLERTTQTLKAIEAEVVAAHATPHPEGLGGVGRHATGGTSDGSGGPLPLPGPTPSPCQASSHMVCTRCPAIFAHVIASNLEALKTLDERRRRAINACLRKDVVGLIGALEHLT